MDSALFCLYAPTKYGKSTAVLQALKPDVTGWILTDPGGLSIALDETLNPWRTAGGALMRPAAVWECFSLERKCFEEMHAASQALARQILDGKLGAGVIDTLTSYSMREYTYAIEIEGEAENYGRANRLVARRIRRVLYPLLEASAKTGAPIVVICHQNDGPSQIDTTFTPCAPALPGKLYKEVPSLFSTVVRLEIQSGKRILRCDPLNTAYITGDRFNCVVDREEANLPAVFTRIVKKIRGVK